MLSSCNTLKPAGQASGTAADATDGAIVRAAATAKARGRRRLSVRMAAASGGRRSGAAVPRYCTSRDGYVQDPPSGDDVAGY